MRIAIDAGHGLYTEGKRCPRVLDPHETCEWTLNDRIAAAVCAGLLRSGLEPIRVDDPTGETDVALTERVRRANDRACDLYLSIHHGWGAGCGVSGGITAYTDLNSDCPSRTLRDALYRAVTEETGLTGNRTQPLREAAYTVLHRTRMPAVLLECGLLDSASDVPVVLTERFAARAAAGIVRGLCIACGLPAPGRLRMTDPAVSAAAQKIQSRTGLPAQTLANVLTVPDGAAVLTQIAAAL